MKWYDIETWKLLKVMIHYFRIFYDVFGLLLKNSFAPVPLDLIGESIAMAPIDRINQASIGKAEIYQVLSSALAVYHDYISSHPEEFRISEEEKKYGKDLDYLLEMDTNHFVRKLYQILLNRDAEWDGFYNNLKLLCDGMPKEAMIYSIAQSPEFGLRFRIRNFSTYQQIYMRYQADQAAVLKYDSLTGRTENPIDRPISDQISEGLSEVDLSGLLGLDINSFIEHIYQCMLNRPADASAFNQYQRLMCQGMPRESVICLIARSDEFDKRFAIKNLSIYEKRHIKYRIKAKIKSFPVLGWIFSLFKFTRNIKNLDTDIRIFEANRSQKEQLGIKNSHRSTSDDNFSFNSVEGQVHLANCMLKEIFELMASGEHRGNDQHDVLSQSLDKLEKSQNKLQYTIDRVMKQQECYQEKLDEILVALAALRLHT